MGSKINFIRSFHCSIFAMVLNKKKNSSIKTLICLITNLPFSMCTEFTRHARSGAVFPQSNTCCQWQLNSYTCQHCAWYQVCGTWFCKVGVTEQTGSEAVSAQHRYRGCTQHAHSCNTSKSTISALLIFL